MPTQIKNHSDSSVKSDLNCLGCFPTSFAPSLKTCTNIEFDYAKSMWTDGSFTEDASKMAKWKNKIGDFWENTEDSYPVQPYQPGNT